MLAADRGGQCEFEFPYQSSEFDHELLCPDREPLFDELFDEPYVPPLPAPQAEEDDEEPPLDPADPLAVLGEAVWDCEFAPDDDPVPVGVDAAGVVDQFCDEESATD